MKSVLRGIAYGVSFFLLFTFILFGCSGSGSNCKAKNSAYSNSHFFDNVTCTPVTPTPIPLQSCTVTSTAKGAKIDCPDGSSVLIDNGAKGGDGSNGNDGSNGSNGTNGADGYSTVVSVIPATVGQCPNGGSVFLMAQDVNRTGVYSIYDPNQASAVVCNGANGSNGSNGSNGQNGITQFIPMTYIRPCGQASSPWKEVLLCLNGSVLADFSDNASGLNTRLAFINAGTYIDTDNSGCTFSVSVSGGSTTVSWNAGSNQYSTWASGNQTCQNEY